MKQLSEHLKQLYYFKNDEQAKPLIVIPQTISRYLKQDTNFIIQKQPKKCNIKNMSLSSIEHGSKIETEFSDKNLEFLELQNNEVEDKCSNKNSSEIDSSHVENFDFIKELNKELSKKPKINKRELSYEKKIFDVYEPDYSSLIEEKSQNTGNKEPLTSFQFFKKVEIQKKKNSTQKNTKKKQSISKLKFSPRKKKLSAVLTKSKKKEDININNIIQRNYSNDKSIKKSMKSLSKKKTHSNSLQNFNMRDKYYNLNNQNKPFNFENSIYNNQFKIHMISLKKRLQKQDYNKNLNNKQLIFQQELDFKIMELNSFKLNSQNNICKLMIPQILSPKILKNTFLKKQLKNLYFRVIQQQKNLIQQLILSKLMKIFRYPSLKMIKQCQIIIQVIMTMFYY